MIHEYLKYKHKNIKTVFRQNKINTISLTRGLYLNGYETDNWLLNTFKNK